MVVLFSSAWLNYEDWRDRLTGLVPGLVLRRWPEIGRADEIEAALVWRPPPGMLATLPRLRLIAGLGAGVDHILADPDLPKGVPIVRLVDPGMTAQMTEYVVWQVLRLHRQDLVYLEQQRLRQWRPLPQPGAGRRRIGILGLGVLGQDAARALGGLGFSVAGWSRSPKTVAGIACHHGEAGLAALAAATDILVCLLPLTPQTKGILNARLFARLPRGAALVSAGRGGHLVEDDLLAALDAGQLSGAALDVTPTEPLPEDHPFWTHPRIALTPHVAAMTEPATAAPIVADTLRRFAEGRPLINTVAVERGY